MLYLFKNKRKSVIALIFGFIFCFINLMEMFLASGSSMTVGKYVMTLLGTVIFGSVIGELYLRLQVWIVKDTPGISKVKDNGNDLKYYGICVLVLCFMYLPVFLAYYPGLFAYDVDTQIPQYITGYSKHHNLLHTLYLHFFYYFIGENVLHSYSAGIAWASIVQMILFAMMISYVHLFLKRIKVNFKVRVIFIILSAILPFFSVLSISMTKDVLFAGFVGMLTVGFYYWDMDEHYYDTPGNVAVYLLALMGTVLFRNNGIYAVLIAFFAGIFFLVVKKRNFRFLIFTGVGIVLSVLISSGIANALSAVNGSQNEMLSVPYQQMAYVYHTENNSLNPEEKAEIEWFLPDVKKYKPCISDPIKANAQGAYHKKELLSCYLKLFFKYPVEYVEAFFIHNAGFFYIGDQSHAEIYGADLEERSGYLLTDTKQGFGVEHISYLKPLENLYETLFSANEYQKVIPLAILCSPAVYFWVLVLLAFYAIDLKKSCWIQFGFVFALILTMLAGPCALIRYALPYIICVPVLGAAVIAKKR